MYKYYATKKLADEDWLTQAAKGYPCIPKDAEVELVDVGRNFYGTFATVRYNGVVYSVKPHDLLRIEVQE